MITPLDDLGPEFSDVEPIDRLVDGTLPDADRRRLLLCLEAEPCGWRRCALAFLEAHAWREAFAPLVAPANVEPAVPAATVKVAKVKPWRIDARRLAVAASLFAALALGWMLRSLEPREVHPDLAKQDLPARAIPKERPPIKVVDSVEPKPPAPEPSEVNPYLEAVVKSLERRGYFAERQKTVVNMRFEDGRERQIPAEEIRLQYTGNRTY